MLASHWRKFAFIAIQIFSISQTVFAQDAKQGVLDARQWDFAKKELSLQGQWAWYDQELRTDIGSWNTFTSFPQLWNEVPLHNGQGYATYALKVILPSNEMKMAIRLPQIYSSYILYVDGNEVARNGVPGRTIKETIPQWRPQTVYFDVNTDTVQLVLQIANFHHHKGGCREPIYLGTAEMLKSKRQWAEISNILECATLALFSIILFFVFQFKSRKRIVIYLALLCLTWAIRSLFSNQYLFIWWVPDFDWNIMIRIEYVSLFFTMLLSVLFVNRLFERESSTIMKYVIIAITTFFILFALIASPVDFTRLLPFNLAVCGLIILYGSVIIVNAYIKERSGSSLLASSLLLAAVVFALDIIAYEGLFEFQVFFFSIAYIVLFGLMGIALLIHTGLLKTTQVKDTLTYDDLYKDSSDTKK